MLIDVNDAFSLQLVMYHTPDIKLLYLSSEEHCHMHTWMLNLNLPTSAKPVMTKLQNVFVALVNLDIFQIALKFSLSTVDCLKMYVLQRYQIEVLFNFA